MAVLLAQDTTFDEMIQEGVSIVDFYSTHCGPCRLLLPTLLELEAQMPFIHLIKVNTDHCPILAEKYMIRSLPTIYLCKDGNMMEYHGYLELEALQEALAKLLYEE